MNIKKKKTIAKRNQNRSEWTVIELTINFKKREWKSNKIELKVLGCVDDQE